MILNKYIRITRILFILSSISLISGQTAKELKQFMETYNKVKIGKEAGEVIKEGVEGEKDPEERPVRLLVKPADIDKYYREKMDVIREDLKALNNMLPFTGRNIPIKYFGYNYFIQRDTIPILNNSNFGPDYILGYGDEIIISVWGQAEQYERATLERDGTIFIKNVGLLYLKGKTQEQAKSYIQSRFSKVYATLKSDPPLTFLEFSIGKIKNINVSVAGHVQFPGNYVVNPSVNLTNLLITAGGVDTTGSLRAIKIQRNGAIIDSVDLYPLISGIGLAKSFRLLDGDIVLVPPRYGTIAITGAVLRPAYFELKEEETLSQLIKYAGGLKYNTGKQIVIIRPGSDSRYVHINNLGSITLTNGDSLFVPFRQVQTLEVTLSSNIKQKSKKTSNKMFPIHFPWYNGLNVGGLISVADYDTANIRHLELVRRSSDGSGYKLVQYLSGNDLSSILNIRLEPFDHLTVQLIEAFYPAEPITLTGQVQSPGEYPLLYGQEKLNSILERSGGLLPSASMASIVIMRDTLTIGSDDGNLVILPGDIINVNRSSGIVRIEGEVHKPGIFEWKPNMHAKDYLDRAGGITAFGDKKHVVYVDPYGKANRVRRWFNPEVEEGSRIIVSEKPITEANVMTDRFQQISALITSLVSIAILANTTGR